MKDLRLSLCSRLCSSEQLYIFLPWVQAGMITAYVIIFLVGLVGNLVVLVVMLSNPHMRTTTNIYLVNLSAADILMCLGKINLNEKQY